MQFNNLVAWALALSFASLVAAQSTVQTTASVTATPASTPEPSESATNNNWTASYTPMIVGVTFGCIAGTLLVVGGIFFHLRRRRTRAHRARVAASKPFPMQMDRTDSEARARCDDLERQLRALREQVDRLEGQQVQHTFGAGDARVFYTNEKDEEALREKKRKSDGAPPTYG
ncbi:hypothetical protein B0H11DRAFT_2134361, partial [Mycena galericulata]